MSNETLKTPTVVSVINLKGGVGKTTVAALLARYAAGKGLKVLAVDMDPQSNLSQALMTEKEYEAFMDNNEPSIVELFSGYIPASDESPAPTSLDEDAVAKQVGHLQHFHLIPSRFNFSDNLIDSAKKTDAHALARFLSQMNMEKNLVLIDCAPTESIITQTAYNASRYILVPVRTEYFSTIGFPLLKESLHSFKRRTGRPIDVCGVLINNSETPGSRRGPHHRAARKSIFEKAKEYGWPIMEIEMYHSTGYPKLMREPYPSYPGYAPEDFALIADEFLKKMGLA